METLSPDILLYMALNMDVPEVLSLCETSTRYNNLICNNQTFWMNKIMVDMPHLAPNIKTYGPDYKLSYQQLAYRFIQLDFILNLIDEDPDVDEDLYEFIETDAVGAVSIFRLRTNLSEDEVRQIFHNITMNMDHEIILRGYYTIQVDNINTDCQDMHLDLNCFNDITDTTRSVTILYDATEADSLAYYQRNLQGMLDRSIDRAKASHYGL